MLTSLLALAILQGPNTLTDAEKAAGWTMLFDGKSTAGWTNFKSDTIGEGWKVIDGVLVCADPSKAGDIVSREKYDWFELVADVNLSPGGNSGIMYRVADDGDATWHSGPEVQLYDHPQQEGVETTGFLYQLYTAKTDAAKPAGQWNTLRIRVAPDKCWTEVNGVRYYEYQLGSDDFKARVAKSKFAPYKDFGKLPTGRIAIQGDHGVVSFRNLKILRLKSE